MEGLAKCDLEVVLYVELKTDLFVQKVVVIEKAPFFVCLWVFWFLVFCLSDSRSAIDLYPCLRSRVFFHLFFQLVLQ